MDLLQRAKLEKAGTLIKEAAYSGETATEAAASDGYLGMSRRDIEAYSILQGIGKKYESVMARASGFGRTQFSGLEAECHTALVKKLGEPAHQGTLYVPSDPLFAAPKRDLTVASGPSFGFGVQTSIGSFVEMLKNKSVTDAMGVQRVPNQRDNLSWAKQTGGPTVIWQSNEGVQATEGNSTFVQLAATPKTAMTHHEVSRLATRQVTPGGEQLFRSGMADGVALAADQAVLVGTGASGQPLGIINTPGIGAVVGTSIDYTKIVEFQTDVNDSNAVITPASTGYVAPPLTAALLKGRQRFTGSDSPLWKGSVASGEIEGCRAMSSKQMPAASLMFGDWSTVYIVEWNVLTIEINPFQDFKAGIIGLRVLWSMDVIVTHPLAFSYASSIT